MSIEYKPILILYTEVPLSREGINHVTKVTNYPVIEIPVDENPRAEIISVDKATVVEDIKKYIDSKISKNEG